MSQTINTPPEWNLGDLYTSPDDPRIERDIARVARESQAFADRYRTRVASLSAGELNAAIAEGEAIQQRGARPENYAALRYAAEISPANGAALQRTREAMTSATLPLLFFPVELKALGEERLLAFADVSELAAYRHHLQTIAAQASHSLSEAEEKLQEELSNTGRRAFVRLFQEVTGNLRCQIVGKEGTVSLTEALHQQTDPDRAVRQASADTITQALQTEERTLTFLMNTLLQEKATQDRLRGYGYAEESRHLSNELTPETVATVVGVVESGYTLVGRYYEAKRRLLGLDQLTHYDRYAPLQASNAGEKSSIGYDDARDLVLRAFARFDEPTYAAAATHFFEGDWIDARVRPNKRGGAFCNYVTPDLHPYLLVNYLGESSDVRTLAHELGHGIHSYLSRGQTYHNYHGTLCMAEVASTFAERLVAEEQNRDATDAERLVALGREIDQVIATTFRQTALYRFEQAIHAHRREKGELTTTQIGDYWQSAIGAMFAGSVTPQPGHASWWSYISHFIGSPFYVYAYSFGEMLALALYRKYQSEGASFVPRYLDMLRAGGSLSPADLTAPLGIDLSDKSFWQGALDVFEAQVAEFERLALTRS